MKNLPTPGAREWIGDAPFPWPPFTTVAVGDLFHACFHLVSVQVLRTKSDKPYLRLQLQDAHGQLEGRVWEEAEQLAGALRDGIYIGVRGRIEVFNNGRQLKVEELAPIAVSLEELELFLPRSRRDPEVIDRELADRIASVEDEGLRALLERMLLPSTEVGSEFRLAPAASRNHHAFLGGLIEHTLSMSSVCELLAQHYAAHIDRDLLIAGALLHDIGKTREIGSRAGFPYTNEGKLLGHILIGLQMVAEAARQVPQLSEDRLLLLQHLIASHQGKYEWQSPREPRTLEALLLHYADDIDAKMQAGIDLVGEVAAGWTRWDRSLGRELMKHSPATAAPVEPARTEPPARSSTPEHTPPPAAEMRDIIEEHPTDPIADAERSDDARSSLPLDLFESGRD